MTEEDKLRLMECDKRDLVELAHRLEELFMRTSRSDWELICDYRDRVSKLEAVAAAALALVQTYDTAHSKRKRRLDRAVAELDARLGACEEPDQRRVAADALFMEIAGI